MRSFLAITKALSDETRIRAIMAISDGELCLCQLVDLLELAPSTVSKHLNILYDAGLIDRRKQGRWAYFRLADKNVPPPIKRALRLVKDSVIDQPQIQADKKARKRIVKQDLTELCGCYD